MPINYKDYNPGFKATVARLKAERGDRCELCYAPNKEWVWRCGKKENSKRMVFPWYPKNHFEPSNFNDYKIPIHFLTRIIITTHHINGDKHEDSPENLLLVCQRCHLRLDAAKHRRKAKATRDKKKGQTSFMEEK